MRNFLSTPMAVKDFTATRTVVTVCKKMLLKWRNAMSIFLLMAFLFSSTASAQCPYAGHPVVNGNPSEWPFILTQNGIPPVLSLRSADVMNGGNTDDKFTNGSADVNLLSNWAWTLSSANDKTDMGDVGAALICDTLYVFADRYAINGDAKIGIWIFKSPVSLNPNGTFNGIHTEGDILIASLFTQGGGVSTPTIFTWTGGALNSGVIGAFGSSAAVNSVQLPVPAGWNYPGSKGGPAGQYLTGAFFEAKIAVSALGGIGIDPCFATVLFETGVSQGTTSALSDLAVTTFSSLPVPNFTNNTPCLGNATNFTNTSTNGSSYLWNFGEPSSGVNNTSTATNPSHTYATAGTFNVKLVVTGISSCKDSITQVVTVNAAAPCGVTGNDNVCPGTTNIYSGPAGNDTYAWSIIAGTAGIPGSTSGPTVSVVAPATCSNYTIQLITTKNGCSTTCSQVFHAVDITPPSVTCPSAATVTCTANLPAAFTTIGSFIAGGGTASDNCTATSSLTISHSDGTITGDINCEYSFIRTYTITDGCGNSSQCTQTLTVDYTGALTPPANGSSTVSCPAAAVNPGAPANILDACGRTVTPALVGSTTPPVCNGSVVWTYRYTACDGTTTADWTYTYTIIYSGGLTAPANGASTVSCPAQAGNPGAPANIVDACGRTVTPALVGSTTPPVCNGSVVWTYRYTACDNTTTADWTYTYTIIYSGGLTAPANATATVSCPADATDPGAPANIADACGRSVSAAFVSRTPETGPTCNGTVVYRYRYTACNGTTTADWTKTYTIIYSGGLTAPANGASTVSCPAQAVNPGAPANIVDACGRT
ncbi:MAG TPA: PKD domain-containing protein, partial [Chitinophagaceae bacterium]|nr:PKD domain-containing protein [Chitinophagaceae bacterium]